MKRKLIVIIGVIVTVLFLSGCLEQNETGPLVKTGKVIKIEYEIAYGGTFTDWRNEIYFDDGSILWTSNDDDLSDIRLHTSGKFYFEKDYFNYDGMRYKFHDFKKVEYYDYGL